MVVVSSGFTEPYPFTHGKVLVWWINFVLVTGLFLEAAVIGGVTSLIGKIDEKAAQHQQRMRSVKEFLELRHVPPAMRSEVLNYFDYASPPPLEPRPFHPPPMDRRCAAAVLPASEASAARGRDPLSAAAAAARAAAARHT